MIVIRAFRVLDATVVSVSHFMDGGPMEPNSHEGTRSLAYRSFQDHPDGCGKDVPEAITETLNDLAEDATAYGGWDLMV